MPENNRTKQRGKQKLEAQLNYQKTALVKTEQELNKTAADMEKPEEPQTIWVRKLRKADSRQKAQAAGFLVWAVF